MTSNAPSSDALRLAAFGALAAFATAHWVALVSDPPIVPAALTVLALTGGAGGLVLTARASTGRAARSLLAALVALATVAIAMVAIGVPVRLLAPGSWSELTAGVREGLVGIQDVSYPYSGGDWWSRLVILLGLPLSLGAAVTLAFWPARKRAPLLRSLALAIVVATYATAVITKPGGAPLLRGLILFALIAAWLWLPRLHRRQALAGGALVAAAGVLALPVAAHLNPDRPWLDYRDWNFDLARGGGTEFSWDHTYGPFEWSRSGETVLEVRSDSPHYWRAAVLDGFDGFRWRSALDGGGPALDLPSSLAGSGAVWDNLNPRWIDWIGYEVRSLQSHLAVTAGAAEDVRGIHAVTTSTGLELQSDVLEEGDTYALRTYSPDPSPARMRATRPRYAPSLAGYTRIHLPLAGSVSPDASTTTILDVPLRGGTGDRRTSRRLLRSPYAPIYKLARRWTAGASTAYDAVAAIEAHLRTGYRYREDVPQRTYPLRAFLFRDGAGYCQQFSGAMALMLRMIGIPSRVAAGFTPGERNNGGFTVRDTDAHSWVEVYFNRIGWVSFDPTPGAAPARSQSTGLPLPASPFERRQFRGTQGGGRASPARRAKAGPSGGVTLWIVPAAAVLALLAAGMAVGARRVRRRSLSQSELAEAQLREVADALRRLGEPIAAGTTLGALERRLRVRRRPAAARYVAGLRANRYQPTPPRPPALSERRTVSRELSARGGVRARLRCLMAFPPGGPAPSRRRRPARAPAPAPAPGPAG